MNNNKWAHRRWIVARGRFADFFRNTAFFTFFWLGGLVVSQAVSFNVTVSNQYGRSAISRVGLQFVEATVAGGYADGAFSVTAADLDQDGSNDVIGAANLASRISWWKYNGSDWLENPIVTNFALPRSVFAVDLNTNGSVDVLGAGSDGVSCWLNGGGGSGWSRINLPSFSNGQSAAAADLDGNGSPDVVAASYARNEVSCWLNDGSASNWTKNVIYSFTNAMSVCIADIDTNGALDVIAGAYSTDMANNMAWWANDGSGSNWTKHALAGGVRSVRCVQTADLNGDQKLDIIAAAYNGPSLQDDIVWWQNDGSGNSWVRHVVASNFDYAYAVKAADMDGNGFVDLVAVSYNTATNLAWWENDGSGANWTFRTIDPLFPRAVAVDVVELNNDGRLDIVGASYDLDTIKWWKNQDQYGTYDSVSAPVGTLIYPAGRRLAGISLTNSIAEATTQYVCRGWTGAGSVISAGTATNTGVFILTNDTSIAWLWETQYYLDIAPQNSNGLVGVAAGWKTSGSVTSVLAGPAIGYFFSGWSGDVAATQTNNNPLILTNDGPRAVRAQFSPLVYTITTIPGTNGTIYPTGEATGRVQVAYGASRSFELLPATGYRVAAVYIDGVFNGLGNMQSFMNVRSNHLLEAAFEPDSYYLYIDSSYGSPSPVGTNEYSGGDAVACTIAGSPILNGVTQRVICTGWTGTGNAPPFGSDTNTGSFTIWEESSVSWHWKIQYWLEVSASNGTVDMASQWRDDGTQVTLTATPSNGYRFAGWIGDVPGHRTNDNPMGMSMDRARYVTAQFSTNLCRISASSAAGGGIAPTGTVYVQPGGSTSFTVSASAGYRIEALTVDGQSVAVTNPYAISYLAFTNVITDHSISASFASDQYRLLIGSAYGTPIPAAGIYSVPNYSTQTCAVAGSPIIDGGTQLMCLGWTGSGSAPHAGLETNTGPFVVTNDSTVIWKWQTQYYLTLEATNGSVNLSNNWYLAGAGATIVPTPVSNYWFSHWSGDVPLGQSNANPLAVLMDQARSLTANFASNRPIITATAGPNGVIAPSGEVTLVYGGSTNFLIVPDAGYRVSTVQVDQVSIGRVGQYSFANVRSNRTIQAAFELDTYTLTMVSDHGVTDPATGIWTLASMSNVVASVTTSPVGDSLTQFVCRGWTGGGSVPASGTTLNVSFTIATNSTLTWNWHSQYWLQTANGPNGTVDVNNAWFEAATNATITAIPNSDYRFHKWTGDVPTTQTNQNPLVLTMDQARSVMAHFSTNRCFISASAGGGGVISPSGVVSVLPGNNSTFVMTPDPGYRLTNIVVDGAAVALTNLYVFTQVINDHSIRAEFTLDVYDLVVASSLAMVSPPPGTNVYVAGSNIVCMATNSPVVNGQTQYVCRGWTGYGCVPAAGLTTNSGYFVITNQSGIAWNWQTQYWLSVSYTSYGTVDVNSAWTTAGTSVILRAQPNVDARFVQWAGAVPSNQLTQNPLTLTMNAARSVQAEFSTNYCLITATAGDNGTIDPSGVIPVIPGATASFTMSPATNYRVDEVIVDGVSSGSPSSYAFATVNADHTISVSFEPDLYDLTIESAHGAVVPSNGVYALLRGSNMACYVEETLVLDGFSRYLLLGWTGSGSVPTSGTAQSTGFFTLTTNTEVAWNWRTQYYLDVAVEGTNGTVDQVNGWFNDGSNLVITATPITPGFRFGGWQGDVPSAQSNSSRITLSMDQPRSIVATFSTNPCRIVATSSQNGQVVPSGTNWVNPGAGIVFTNEPSTHCMVAYMIVDGLYVPADGVYAFTNVIEDHTLHTVFDIAPVSLLIGSDLTFARSDPPMGLSSYTWNSAIECRLTNSPLLRGRSKFVCSGWTGSGSVPASGVSVTTGVFSITNDSSIMWNWQTQNYFAVEALPPRGSFVPASGWYSVGSTLLVTANNDPYWYFTGWTGETNGSTVVSTNQLLLPMDQPRTIEGLFSPDLAPYRTPLWWLASYGLTNPSFAVAELADQDFDGMLSWQEYVTGTDPTNAASYFAVNPIGSASSDHIMIRWPSEIGRLYSVSLSTNVLAGGWTLAPGFIDLSGTGGIMSFTNAATDILFHRVRVEMAP
ncbi:MAG: hypothetical protein A2X46_19240 [Lentisphaerae bacterium GWF2_57_35]|nr:MAG: hypothetical protein A2X46_19240 [Lentisphaerae bacterium GWF2_57_35]